MGCEDKENGEQGYELKRKCSILIKTELFQSFKVQREKYNKDMKFSAALDAPLFAWS